MSKIEQTDCFYPKDGWVDIAILKGYLEHSESKGDTHIRITPTDDGVRFETGKEKEIITKPIYPPIPDNNHDWEAYYEDWDIGDPIGYGKTEQEAINDLKEKQEH